MKKGKKYSDSLKLIDRTKQYDPEEAIQRHRQDRSRAGDLQGRQGRRG